MARYSVFAAVSVVFLATGCGAADERVASQAAPATGEENSAAGGKANPAQPEQAATVAPLVVIASDGPAMSESARSVCDEVMKIANERRESGEIFYSIAASRGDISIPHWSPLDVKINENLIVEGLYDGWCEAPARVNPSTSAAFTEADIALCREERLAGVRELLAGEPRLEQAELDIDRDGDADAVYQLHPDPAFADRSGEAWVLWNLQPRIFVSAEENPDLHRQLHKTIFAPEASLFLRGGELYALRAWNGEADRFEIFEIRRTQGRLGQAPLCLLTTETDSDV